MAKPVNPGALEERRRLLALLDRLDAVDPRCLPVDIAARWRLGDADARRQIEASIDHLPCRPA